MAMFLRPRCPSHMIDMAPLIDVVFLLLVFFMLTSNFVPPALPLQLPKASGEDAASGVAVVVSLDTSGTLTVDGSPVAEAEFASALARALKDAGTSTVHFRGDRSIDYGAFVDLMDRARKSGVGQFHLVHETARGKDD